nr:redoxin domain-containing protein [Plesiocystis pacifica]
MPELEQSVWQPYQDQGVKVWGLHQGENPPEIEDFIEQTGVTFPIITDDGYTLDKVAYPAGVGYPYPRDVIVGKDLTIRAIRNSFNPSEIEALIEELLAE